VVDTRQTRDHLFKHCYKWKDQQAVMWARVKEATKRGSRSGTWADERCSPAVLDFSRSTHVGRTASPVGENWDCEVEARRSKRSSDPRALGIGFSSVCFLSVMCTFLVAGFSCFHTFISLVLTQCAQFVGGGGRRFCHRARPSGRDG